ncbi:MAG: NAD-binding protein, partial [Chitinophagales bacterium]
SVSLGAFVAGLVISESEYTHEIMGKIVSFRDAFVVLFFVAVGMMVNPSGLLADWLDSLVVLAVIIVGKFLVVFLIVKAFGFNNRIAFYSGMGLLQTGEFSIFLAGIGLGGSLISTSLYNIILATAIISIMLTPMFIEAAPRVYAFMASKRRIRDRAGEPPTEEIAALRDHVILCGYGRVGHHIGDALLRTSIPFVVIDYDYLVTKELSSKGIPFIYGDSANDIVLSQANPQNASMAILTLPDVFSNRNAVRNLQKLNSSLTILARAHTNLEKALLYKLGVDVVVQPETEAGMKMIWHMMFKLNLSAEKIDSYLAFMLEKDYHRLFSAHSDGQETIETLQLEEFMLLDDSSWVNKSLRESSIRQSTGCYVVSIRKANGKTKPNPHSHEVLEEGDMVIVMGTASQLLHFANYVGEEKDG